MTSDQLYNQYKNTSIASFDGNSANDGQCEQWYLMNRTKRDGLGVIGGNAIDRWYSQETQYYDYIPYKSGVYPIKDDYVVWGTGVGSSAGHIDVCAQNGGPTGFLGYDSNWNDVPVLKTISHTYAYGILGYVRVKGSTISPMTPEQVTLAYQFMVFRNPNQDELNKGLIMTWYDLETAIDQTAERKAIVGKVKDYDHLYQTAENAQNQAAALQKELNGMANPTMLQPGIYRVQ